VDYLSYLSLSDGGWARELAQGLSITLMLAAATLPIGLALGLALAGASLSSRRLISATATIISTVFRSLPELLTLFIIYYGGQILINKFLALVMPDARISISPFAAGMLALGIVFAAFASEIFIAAIRAVPKGQSEAAAALGLGRAVAFFRVIGPQVLRLSLPGLGNLWFVLLKDTSLVSVIALNDLMRQTQVAIASTKSPLFFYLICCLIYLAVSLLSSLAISILEKWTNRGLERTS
jgi:polar amino acid transport system permease protein